LNGWDQAVAKTLLFSYDRLIPKETKARVAKIEIFDEVKLDLSMKDFFY